jgi:dTDP-3-amino-3,4,6-trideoxy-alpha-D-glucose transaminase
MPSSIPLGDPKRESARIRSEVDQALDRVLQRGWFVLGEEGEAFETEWAEYCGVAHAVGVGNGTDAIQLILRAAGIGPGDEVIVPAFASAWTALAVSMAGAAPVFADVDPERYTLDPAAFEAAITPRTAAVIAVHLYGCPADMTVLAELGRRHSLMVLEDAAQAHGARCQGARAGGLADAAAFSFHPSQNLGAYGDAGAVTTADASLADKLRLLRHGGQRRAHVHELLGVNSHLDEIQAAILRVKLPHLDSWNRQRQALASRYDAGFCDSDDLVLPVAIEGVEHVYHRYVVRTSHRDRLRDYLAGAWVDTGIHYPQPVHLQGAFRHLGYEPGSCPNAEALVTEVLSLPIFPQLSTREVDKITHLMRFFFAMR